MPVPFILVTTHAIQPAHVEEFTAAAAEYADFVETHEPRVQQQYVYLNDEQTEVSVVHIHADAESADAHMQAAAEQLGRGLALTDGNLRIEAYGVPGPVLTQALEANASNGTSVSVKAASLGGFSR